jgi:hypothetical protein
MTTEIISRRGQRPDEPGTPATEPFSPSPGGTPVSNSAPVTTSYSLLLSNSRNMAYIQATVTGLLAEDVVVTLYGGAVASGDALQHFSLESSSQEQTMVYRWGAGYYIGLSQKSYSDGDSSYTQLASAGPS